ncbi:hypothetical protein E4U14_000825 [Claviceps sp. LM454 group G7]|nr:hypothetical protein E4U14_000825 [Claviceps sp. LM454 group G7]
MESPTPDILPRGHVATTATDGRRLSSLETNQLTSFDIVFPTSYEPGPYSSFVRVDGGDYIAHPTAPATATAAVSAETRRANFIQARRIFAAEVQVLRDFAAAYTRGEPDLNDTRYAASQP